MTLAEDVPMNDFGVREALDREFIINTYRHSGTILYLKKASRWFPVIELILKNKEFQMTSNIYVIERNEPSC